MGEGRVAGPGVQAGGGRQGKLADARAQGGAALSRPGQTRAQAPRIDALPHPRLRNPTLPGWWNW